MVAIDNLVRKEVARMKAYARPPRIDAFVKLNQNESPFNIPEELVEAFIERLRKIDFNRYNEGSSENLRKLVAKKFKVSPEQVIMGCGIDELLYYLIFAFVNPEDKLVRPVPSFSMYPICAEVTSAKDVPVSLGKDYELTKEFEKESKDAKLTIICTPNNPTANSFSKKIIERVIKNASGLVCIDEAYAEFAGEDCAEFLKYENVILMRTFSKAYSGAGIRLGYAIANEKVVDYMNRLRLPWNVNIMTQVLGEILLENEAIFAERIKEIKGNRKKLASKLEKLVPTLSSDCNFILFEVENPDQVFEALTQSGVLIRNISKCPALGKYLRVNVGTEEENNRFIETLKRAIEPVDSVIFDIDGVLVDVSNSYRQAIIRTVMEFAGKRVSNSDIDKLKEIPGFNNDWDCTYALAKGIWKPLDGRQRNSGEYLKMKEYFQKIYLGELIQKEESLVELETLDYLAGLGYKIGVVTSRPREEALIALKNAGLIPKYMSENSIVAQEDAKEKPSPEGLLKSQKILGTRNTIYVGDTPSDRLAAFNAKMRFILCNSKSGLNIPRINSVNELKGCFR